MNNVAKQARGVGIDKLARSAPASISAAQTSVWPFSAAYVSAVSPVAVDAFTLHSGKVANKNNENKIATSKGFERQNSPCLRRNLTTSTWPSWAASMSGVLAPNSQLAPALMRRLATSKKPPQHASVKAVSPVSSVCAFTSASTKAVRIKMQFDSAFSLPQTFSYHNWARGWPFLHGLPVLLPSGVCNLRHSLPQYWRLDQSTVWPVLYDPRRRQVSKGIRSCRLAY